jgi:hypothetical protein
MVEYQKIDKRLQMSKKCLKELKSLIEEIVLPDIEDYIDDIFEEIAGNKNVSDNIENILSVDVLKDDILDFNNNYSEYRNNVDMVNALLGLDLGSVSINNEGHLLVSQIEPTSTPSINSDGHLVVNYS